MHDRVVRRLSLTVAVAVIGALLVSVIVSVPAEADTAITASSSAYAYSENAVTEPNLEVPKAQAVVPPPPEQTRVETARDRDVLLDALIVLGVVEADACIRDGAPATLQTEIRVAQIQARGEEPADDDNDTNDGPNDEDPERAEATPIEGFNDGCMRLVRRGATASPSPTDTGTPSPGPVTPTPTPTPTATPTTTVTPTPSPTATPGATTTNCEDADTDPASEDFTGPNCLATLPLWNARSYAMGIDPLLGEDFEAEAVARCVNGRAEFATGARFGLISGILGADSGRGPNQQFDLILATGALVTFWETNWDPVTNTTTDGSSTVYVNAARIQTPAEELIIGHAEATVECTADASPSGGTITVTQTAPTPPVPEGGFPRDISLTPSKNVVLYSKIFSLSGAVTPANQFQTPRRCVEGVTLTIRRDPIGGPEEFVDVGTVVTDQQGNYTFNYQADVNSQWLAFIDKDNPTDCALATSNARPVLVKPFVKLRISQKTPRHGKTVRLRGIVEPCLDHPGTRLKLKRVFDSKLVEVDTKALDGNCMADFFVRATFRHAVFQVAWPKQDEDHQTGKSRPKVINTKGRRRG